MKSTKKILLFSTAAFVISTVVPLHATEEQITQDTPTLQWSLAEKAFGAAFFASLVRYNVRRGNNNPSRCNFSRLKNSITGSLSNKNNMISCTILGYDVEQADKKELKSITVGIRTADYELVPFAKINILKAERSDLKKACETRVLEDTPAYAAYNPTMQTKYWIKPELNCTVKLFAIHKVSAESSVSFVAIDPQFVELSKAKTICCETDLASMLATQKTSISAIANELWGIIDDGIIGHAGKAGGTEVDLKTGKLISGTATNPKGLYGNIQHYWRPLSLAATTYGSFWALQHPEMALKLLEKAKAGFFKNVFPSLPALEQCIEKATSTTKQ